MEDVKKMKNIQSANAKVVQDLEPAAVFRYFGELCSIPHGSGNVKGISDYCVKFAEEHGLSYRQDNYYNVVIKKPASKGYEDKDTVIIQGHLDMVSVKEAECPKNLEMEGLDLEYSDGYLYAKQTSLGADDGIAVAYALAILAAQDIEHPAIEAVFTVDEEIGMLGATAMDLSDISGKYMLNIDSEEEGIFIAGCAGGATVRCKFPVERENLKGYRVNLIIDGLTGGHSGVEIIYGRANANVLLGRVLRNISKECEIGIINVRGGEKDNAIAKFAEAQLIVPGKDIDKLEAITALMNDTIKAEYINTDSGMSIKAIKDSETEKEAEVVVKICADRIIASLICLPNGVQKMSSDIEGLVQTSLNPGILECNASEVVISYSVRSAVGSEKEELIDRMECLTEQLGGACDISGEYPAWEYQRESKLRDVMSSVYEKMYGSRPQIQTIHAGVECGIIADKVKNLDCISFGPDIKNIHTAKEKLHVASAKRTWELILEVLKKL